MTKQLSPAALTVWSAFLDRYEWEVTTEELFAVAAALRAAADQVVPPEQERLFDEERPWDVELGGVIDVREQFLAIARELEGRR